MQYYNSKIAYYSKADSIRYNVSCKQWEFNAGGIENRKNQEDK